jgi:hypothetical protein
MEITKDGSRDEEEIWLGYEIDGEKRGDRRGLKIRS